MITISEEDTLANADFYVQTETGMDYVGSLFEDGSPAYVDDLDLFGPAENRSYDEATFRRLVGGMLQESREQGVGSAADAGDRWPWPWPDSAMTDYVYLYVKGAVQVFRTGLDEHGNAGQFLAAVHYPNGARKATRFPPQGAR